jgi:hypothetical protein
VIRKGMVDIKKNKVSPRLGRHYVEILHIDTVKNTQLFSGIPSAQIAACNRSFEEFVKNCCHENNGFWRGFEGDGGRAYFYSDVKRGNSIEAAKLILKGLRAADVPCQEILRNEGFRRHIRIKIHFGLINVNSDPGHDVDGASLLSLFLKNERKLAPIKNTLFITQEMFEHIDPWEKEEFDVYRRKVVYDEISGTHTCIHKLIANPQPKNSEKIFSRTNGVLEKTELRYVVDHIKILYASINHRNNITLGLTQELTHLLQKPNSRASKSINGKSLLRLTFLNLLSFLDAHHSDSQEVIFNASYWRLSKNQKTLRQVKFKSLADGTLVRPVRSVNIKDDAFHVVQALTQKTVIVAGTVRSLAEKGEWRYFDEPQSSDVRRLESAIQIPIYKWDGVDYLGENVTHINQKKVMIGVLSIDADMPDIFHSIEAADWVDILAGFIANIVLAETISQFSK